MGRARRGRHVARARVAAPRPIKAYPSADSLATILVAATANDLGADVKLKPMEYQALSRVLHGLDVSRDITESLRDLWDGVRFDSAN